MMFLKFPFQRLITALLLSVFLLSFGMIFCMMSGMTMQMDMPCGGGDETVLCPMFISALHIDMWRNVVPENGMYFFYAIQSLLFISLLIFLHQRAGILARDRLYIIRQKFLRTHSYTELFRKGILNPKLFAAPQAVS